MCSIQQYSPGVIQDPTLKLVMASKRNQDIYEEIEYSDDFEQDDDEDYEYDDDMADGASCDEIRVYKSLTGPSLTIQPRQKKPCTPFRTGSGGDLSPRKKDASARTFPIPKRNSKVFVTNKRNVKPAISKSTSTVSIPNPSGNTKTRNEVLGMDNNYANDTRSTKFDSNKAKTFSRAKFTASFQSLSFSIDGRKQTSMEPMTPLNRKNPVITSSIGQRKVIGSPFLPPMKLGVAKAMGSVAQRVASAKRMTINELKDKIKELQTEMNNLKKENSALKHVDYRRQQALRKWEGREAELPRLMNQHKEELRNAQMQVKKVSGQSKELELRIKQKDKRIAILSHDLQKLQTLCQETELEERQDLQSQLETVTANLCGAEKRIRQLQRHNEILEKNHLHQVEVERQKLIKANKHSLDLGNEIMRLKQCLRDKDRMLNYVQMRSQGRTLIRSFHEESRTKSTKYPSKQNSSFGFSSKLNESYSRSTSPQNRSSSDLVHPHPGGGDNSSATQNLTQNLSHGGNRRRPLGSNRSNPCNEYDPSYFSKLGSWC